MSRATSVAVVITCHDLGRTLDEAVHSVLAQTLAPAELVIVDDGSTDIYTIQVLSRLRSHGIRVVVTPNRGVSSARNTGIRQTVSSYIVLLDADDRLDPTYLQKAAALLDRRRELMFVSCGMKCFGSADEIWFPQQPDLIESMTHGVVHVSSMFRRELWSAVGGFDEELRAHEEVDFWTTALEHGFDGYVLPEPLFHYRIRPDSMYHGAMKKNTHVRLMDHVYRKHHATLQRHAEQLLVAKEQFILDQKQHHASLMERKRDVESQLQRLDQAIAAVVCQLHARGRSRVEFGDLRRTTPISPVWGLDRGLPLDRYYIHRFLGRHRADIRGSVLEVKDSGYTRRFGDDRVTFVDVLDIDPANQHATIIADLANADTVASDSYDCVILTQTLGLIYDVTSAIRHAIRVLRPGGVLLCTVPAAGRISYEQSGLDHDYWRFTEASIRRTFADVCPPQAFEVSGFGNVLACTAFLYGLTPEELTPTELDTVDPFFPLLYAVRATKPGGAAVRDLFALEHAAACRDSQWAHSPPVRHTSNLIPRTARADVDRPRPMSDQDDETTALMRVNPGTAGKVPKALVTGWFSFAEGHATAGDLLARDLTCQWLNRAGYSYDVAAVSPFGGMVDWRTVDPGDYSVAIFVCGPFAKGEGLELQWLERFSSCRRIGLNLSVLEPLDSWNPFDVLLERDSSSRVRPDIVFLSPPARVPVVGLCLLEKAEGVATEVAEAALRRLITPRDVTVVYVDTRLDKNETGLHSPAQIESLIARMDVVLTTRLHGMVLALKNGVPVVAIDPVPGGGKITKQAKVIEWPVVQRVDTLSDADLVRGFDYCLTGDARAQAIECFKRATESAEAVREDFLAALSTSPKHPLDL